MEGDRILQNILKKESRQLQDLKRYTAPLDKLLANDTLKYVCSKPTEYEKLRKYGLFCMKLLRYCIEALSKGKKHTDGNQMQEDCFKCAETGADMLSKLFQSGVTLPSEISVSAVIKLFFHLIITALKNSYVNHLPQITRSLLSITWTALESGEEKMFKDSTGLCKQISDHLWNAAVKLPKNMEQQQKALLALSLRENSIELLAVAKLDVCLMIERGLQAQRQFQIDFAGVSEKETERSFLLTLLNNVITFPDYQLDRNIHLYSRVEDLCISCCKLISAPSHVNELLQNFNRLSKMDMKSNDASQTRFNVFQSIIQILLCALCLRLKEENEFKNCEYDLELQWSAIQKRLVRTTGALRHLDSNAYVESEIVLAITYLRCICSKIFKTTTVDNASDNLVKMPSETLAALTDVLLVSYNIQSHVLKTKNNCAQYVSTCNTWEMIVQPKLALLYLISSVILKRFSTGLLKMPQNGRKVSIQRDYVAIMFEGIKMLDQVVGEVPAALDQYVHFARTVFNIALMLSKCGQINDACSLARLSCDAATKWYLARTTENEAMTKVLLHKKYELLSNCLEKQGDWLECVCATSLCCQYYVLCAGNLKVSDEKATQYVAMWCERKHLAIKQLSNENDFHKVQGCHLDGDYGGPNLSQEQVCTLLRMELESYKKKLRSSSISDQLRVVEKLMSYYTLLEDERNCVLMKLEKVKLMYNRAVQLDNTSLSDGLNICEELITNVSEMLHEREESMMFKDILASIYFWRFILQYSNSIPKTKEEIRESDSDDADGQGDAVSSEASSHSVKANSLSFLMSLHSAVNTWTEMVNDVVKAKSKLDVYSQRETSWMLQIASSVYDFLDMPLLRIHTLLVLATFARCCGDNENLETAAIANSLAMQSLCEEGNIHCAEMLSNDCEKIISTLGVDCQDLTTYVFTLAKSQLLLCKGKYDEGWEVLKTIVNALKENERTITRFVLVKAKLLGVRYMSLPTNLCKASREDVDGCSYFEYLLNTSKHAEALVNRLVEHRASAEFAGLNKKENAVFLSHWSLLSELCRCFLDIGKIYLLQGSVRQAKCYLQNGREIARRFLSPNRFFDITMKLAELKAVLNEAEQCKAYLEDAINVLTPDLSLADILEQRKLLSVSNDREKSSFADYETVSASRLRLNLLHCYCEYVKLTGNISDVKKIILLSHDLRQNSIERYQEALERLEDMFAVTLGSKLEQPDEKPLVVTTHAKRSNKTKGTRVKTAAKQSKRDESSEFIPRKTDVASLVFLTSCLKTYALEGDVALREGDFPRLLQTVQAGLAMVQWAQGIVSDPLLLDFMSTSLLHYLQGVAHVLASKDGFGSWHVAGSHPTHTAEGSDVEDMSEVMSNLDLSETREKSRAKSRRGVNNGKRAMKNTKNEEICDESPVEDFHSDSSSVVEKKRDRGRAKSTALHSSASTRSKSTSRINITQTLVTDISARDMAAGAQTELQRTRSSCRKSVKNVSTKRSSKPRRNVSRESETRGVTSGGNVEQEGRVVKGRRKCSKLSRNLTDENEGDIDTWDDLEPTIEEDKDMKKALDSFDSSLKYLYPYFNSVLLTRICHALVWCHGFKCPVKTAVYHNIAMAATLRHEALYRSAVKIRKESDKKIKYTNKESELLQLLESGTLDKDGRKSVHQMLHFQTIREHIDFKMYDCDVVESFKNSIDFLPDDLTVCTLSILQAPDRENVKRLVITRLRKTSEPLVVKLTLPNEEDEGDFMENDFQSNDSLVRDLSSIFRKNILGDFAAILRENTESYKIKNYREWWSTREKIDGKLKKLVKRMQDTWFQRWCGILSGRRLAEKDRSCLQTNIEYIQQMARKIIGRTVQNDQLLEVLIDSYHHLKPAEVIKALTDLTDMQANCEQLCRFSKALSDFIHDNERADNAASIARGPVILVLDKSIQHLPFESMPILRDQEVSRMPSLQFITAHLNVQKMMMSRVDTRQTYYVLNPSNDLSKTEKRFSDWFKSEEGWKGVVGRPPSATEFKEGLANHHLFLYLGHGNGREFLKGDEVTRLYCKAVTILMGCSSGKLIVEGECEARGMALNYILSGCPAVVGNLWDVTDGGIDKFTMKFLHMFFEQGDKRSLTQCVIRSRGECNMKYINGSAPVVYGMPVFAGR